MPIPLESVKTTPTKPCNLHRKQRSAGNGEEIAADAQSHRTLAVLALAGMAAVLTPIQTKAATALVEFFLSWAAGEALSSAKNAILAVNGGLNKTPGATLSPSAKAVANTAYWLSNSFEQITKEDEWNSDTMQWTGN